MALNGNLSTMTVAEILGWLHGGVKSGGLQVERGRALRQLYFEGGRLTGCMTNEPPMLLGQFLLSRNKVSEDQLQQALAKQEESGERIGDILVADGVLAPGEIDAFVQAKASEIVLSLFDWEEAVFRFDLEALRHPHTVAVSMEIPEILPRGRARHEEMKRLREVFPDEGVVLERTGAAPPPELYENPLAARTFQAIDGERTLADLLLQVPASKYLVIKFLNQLCRMELARLKEVRPLARENQQAAGTTLAWTLPPLAAGSEEAERAIREARTSIEQGCFEEALEQLYAARRAHPGDRTCERLIVQAEQALEQKHHEELPTSMIPCLRAGVAGVAGSPERTYLASLIDGRRDIQSIVWLAPLRPVDVLRTLSGMLQAGQIEVRPPAATSA